MPSTKLVVIVGGCGHVGLPLGIVFASCGVNVVLLDIDERKIAIVNSGCMPFIEKSAEELLRVVIGKSLVATSDNSCLHNADAVIAVLGTPVDEHLNPTVTDLYRYIDTALDLLPEDSL